VEGDPQTEYSGVCRVDETEDRFGGEVPASKTYNVGDGRLDCRIRKESAGPGSLKVFLVSGGDRVVQRTNAEGGTIELSYSAGRITSSTSGGGVSSSSSQQVISSSSSR
jgi:hypothetical protein